MFWKTLFILLKTFASFIVVLGICFILCRFVVYHFIRLLSVLSKELQLLGTLGIMFVLLLITQWLGISMELGCFLGGFILASSSNSHGMPNRRGGISIVSIRKHILISRKLKMSIGASRISYPV